MKFSVSNNDVQEHSRIMLKGVKILRVPCIYTENGNFRLFVANENGNGKLPFVSANGKRKFVFLGRQTLSDNQRLLIKKVDISISVRIMSFSC